MPDHDEARILKFEQKCEVKGIKAKLAEKIVCYHDTQPHPSSTASVPFFSPIYALKYFCDA